eukprot:492540_1
MITRSILEEIKDSISSEDVPVHDHTNEQIIKELLQRRLIIFTEINVILFIMYGLNKCIIMSLVDYYILGLQIFIIAVLLTTKPIPLLSNGDVLIVNYCDKDIILDLIYLVFDENMEQFRCITLVFAVLSNTDFVTVICHTICIIHIINICNMSIIFQVLLTLSFYFRNKFVNKQILYYSLKIISEYVIAKGTTPRTGICIILFRYLWYIYYNLKTKGTNP